MSNINMNSGFQVPAQKLKTFPVELTTSLADVYTADAYRKPTLASIHVVNKTAGALTFDLVYYNGTTDFYLAKTHALAASDTFTLQSNDDHFMALEEGYKIKALGSANTSIDCFVSVYESEGRRTT